MSLGLRIAALHPEVREDIRKALTGAADALELPNGPTTVLIVSSSLCLKLLKMVFEEAGKPQPSENLYSCIVRAGQGDEKSSGLRLIPIEISDDLHWVRRRSNKADHDALQIEPDHYHGQQVLEMVLRLVEWFYCTYEHGPRLQSAYAGGSEYARAATRWPEDILARRPPHAGTTVFVHVARKLVTWLQEDDAPVVLHAAPGAGKSRVAAALFPPPDKLCGRVPVWCQGSEVEQVLHALADLQSRSPGLRMCLFLDEDHRRDRGKEFFEKFLKCGNQWARHQVVLVLRSSTYEALGDAAAGARVLSLRGGKEVLEDCHAWGLDRSLTPEEIRRICEFATDARGNLNSLLVHRICVEQLRDGGTFDTLDGEDHLDSLYQGLVANQPEGRRSLLLALSRCLAHTRRVGLPLLLAALEAGGTSMEPDEAEHELISLEDDGLVERLDGHGALGSPKWLPFHDLLHQSVQKHLGRRRPRRAVSAEDLEGLVASRVLASVPSLTALRQSVDCWVDLVAGTRRGHLRLLEALVRQAARLRSAGVGNLEILDAFSKASLGLGMLLHSSGDYSDPSLQDAFQGLAQVFEEYLKPRLLREVIESAEDGPPVLNVIGNGHRLLRAGIASRRLPSQSIGELVHSRIPALHGIAVKLDLPEADTVFNEYPGYLTRIRYAQLLMWARRWNEAGLAYERIVREATQEGEIDVWDAPGLWTFAIASYLEGGLSEQAYDACGTAARSVSTAEGLEALADFYRGLAEELAASPQPVSWRTLMLRYGRTCLERLSALALVVLSAPREGASASILAARFREAGRDCVWLTSDSLESIEELGGERACVLLGGNQTLAFQLMEPYLSADQILDGVFRLRHPPAYGCVEFQVGSRPAVWLAGHYPWDTIRAVRNWIDEGGPARLAERTGVSSGRKLGESQQTPHQVPRAGPSEGL